MPRLFTHVVARQPLTPRPACRMRHPDFSKGKVTVTETVPRLAALERHAFFLDLDGTLAPIASRPELAAVPATTVKILQGLQQACGGAVAIVSGRGLETIDTLLAPLQLPAAALHGAIWRGPTGEVHQQAIDTQALAHMREALRALVARDAGLQLEDKGSALAMHYRGAPQWRDEVQETVAELLRDHQDSFTALPGKMVLEIKPKFADKGLAIARFMEMEPFMGRTPVFAGDDLTDETGFQVVRLMHGVSIKIGPEPTQAQWRLADPAALAQWMGEQD